MDDERPIYEIPVTSRREARLRENGVGSAESAPAPTLSPVPSLAVPPAPGSATST